MRKPAKFRVGQVVAVQWDSGTVEFYKLRVSSELQGERLWRVFGIRGGIGQEISEERMRPLTAREIGPVRDRWRKGER